MIQHHEHPRDAGAFVCQQLVQRNVRKRRGDRDDALMSLERQLVEKSTLLEAHGDVTLLSSRQQRTQRAVLRPVGGDVDRTQILAGYQRFVYGVNAVDEIVEIYPSTPALRASAQDDLGGARLVSAKL